MGPNTSRAVKQPTVTKTTTANTLAGKVAQSTNIQSPESSNSSPIELVTTLEGVDFTREYHGVEDSDYFLPSDFIEQDRLELQHYLLRHLFKGDVTREDIKNFVATNPNSKILDVGCANGYWLDSMSKIYPLAELHGVDLAPSIIENAAKFLPKANFTVGNVVTGLPYEDNSFDFVHQRYLILGLPGDQFPTAIRELIRVTKPGGWIELVELILTSFKMQTDVVAYRSGPIMDKVLAAVKEIMAPRKLDLFAGLNLVNYVKLATKKTSLTAVNLQKRTVSVPCNWGGPIGELAGADAKQLYLTMEDFLHRQLGVEREEYKELIDKMIE
ncbi:hypothetical protein HK100_004346, partial [Physocladia obscura]